MPLRGMMCGGNLCEIGAIEFDVAGARCHEPHDAAQRRRFPDAVATEQCSALAFLDLQIDALKDVQFSDMDVNIHGG